MSDPTAADVVAPATASASAPAGAVTCPDCSGEGGSTCHVHRADGPDSWEWRRCERCRGFGAITPEEMDRYTYGRAMAEDRKARGLTLRREAIRRGLSPKALADMEWGRA